MMATPPAVQLGELCSERVGSQVRGVGHQLSLMNAWSK
jgi:hypothetical protein